MGQAWSLVWKLPLTLGVGALGGMLFARLGVPNGLRIGAMAGAALLSVFFSAAWMPPGTKTLVQAVAGALIGCSTERSDLARLPAILKPTLIMLASYLVLNLGVGTAVYALGGADLVTSLMCVVPGGVTDTPAIAADMGAQTADVAVVQLARYLLGVAVFPPMILFFTRPLSGNVTTDRPDRTDRHRVKTENSSPGAVLVTFAAALGMGCLGGLTGIPAGTFLFALIAVLILKLRFNYACISRGERKLILLISGCYIGSGITLADALNFRKLVLPILVVLAGYTANCFVTGRIISLTCGFSRREGMLITTPAGASDIALSAEDLGVDNTDVIVIQILRSVIALALFPQIIDLLVHLAES